MANNLILLGNAAHSSRSPHKIVLHEMIIGETQRREWVVILMHWHGFAHSLEDGWISLTNNAAKRALCLGGRSWLFAGSDSEGVRAETMYAIADAT